MHLLSAAPAGSEDVEQAVDLGQGPADIVVLSAADTELACLAAARARLPAAGFPSLRLANLLHLAHPLSVDLYLERTAAHAKLVVARLLGGRAYWPYGAERLAALCRDRGIALAVLPGDARDDPALAELSTLSEADRRRLLAYLAHGGPANAEHLLRYAASLLGHPTDWAEPRPLPPAALHAPGLPPSPTLAEVRAGWLPGRPTAAVLFYRALLQGADLAPVDALLEALDRHGLNALALAVTSLKDPAASAIAESVLADAAPDVILNATGFAVSGPDPLAARDRPTLQLVLASGDEPSWRAGTRGLGPRDLAMSVALPEVDGRVLAAAISFKAEAAPDPLTQSRRVAHRPVPDRVDHAARLAAAWARLRRTPAHARRVALILANYPTRDGRVGNGVGLDTPASAVEALRALREAGYAADTPFADGDALVRTLLAARRNPAIRLPLARYESWFATVPPDARETITLRWGAPAADPAIENGSFPVAVLPLGNLALAVQPPRGYGVDPAATYHSPDLPPPHAYLALYLWLRETFAAHAVVHLGKHGNLEWLPGKSLGLSSSCHPELALGPLPHLYPFIVNDPGEGTQAKRRAAAVIIDHLTPPLTRAESHGDLRELERLLDEHHQASALDPRRARHLEREILASSAHLGLAADLALDPADPTAETLRRLDAHVCELKELQIRDGLHTLGRSPTGDQRTDLLLALARSPRARGEGAEASLHRALARDLGLADWDPLAPDLAAPWTGPHPPALAALSPDPWRTAGDTVERLEHLARALVAADRPCDPAWPATEAVLAELTSRLAPSLDACGPAELANLLRGLDGRFVPPGPSGAPTRGRADVLPTGRNFFSVDTRAVPTPAAYALGWRSAAMVVERHLQDHGDWPRRVALSAWGTSCMRTGGDDLAQALALMGCRPTWDPDSGRVTGVEVLPLSLLDRPRVDVTLRVSGLFRDAFPAQLELLDDAVRAVAALDEPDDQNPLAAAARTETSRLVSEGVSEAAARRRATLRVFGSKPGAYGAGLQAPIDEGGWETSADLAETYLAWSSYAYGRSLEGAEAAPDLRHRLAQTELVLHNQDSREHDLLDSDDYYQFEGGLIAAVRELSRSQPEAYHLDHSRPDHPRVRRLQEEIGLIVRGRCANPKWIAGVMRHGYKGAFEIAATVDYLFAFAATAGVVTDRHFDALFDAYLGDEAVRAFMARHNPDALRETADRFAEAARRNLWRPSRNSALTSIAELRSAPARA